MPTNIGWTDETWNPVHGCSKVSRGCRHCYAERLSLDADTWGTDKPWTPRNAAENVTEKPHKLDDPRSFPDYSPEDWAIQKRIPFGDSPTFRSGRHPLRVFTNSMSDLFHPEVSTAFIRKVVGVMRNHSAYVFQVLTKRPDELVERESINWPDNVWVGVSVEDAAVTDRIDVLREVGVATRFVSFEPLVGPVGEVDLEGIDWAIVGGETHPEGDYAPMDHAWARAIRDQCHAQETAFFFKQSAGKRPETNPYLKLRSGGAHPYREFPPLPDVTIDAQPPKQTRLSDLA